MTKIVNEFEYNLSNLVFVIVFITLSWNAD